ncbi:hypothetical protein [Streptomyces sp. NPDC051909]|uniref:hypothetical protein n=1 Tax=Streptomyces sp. NPDC051909 TaxID=3154944 RepID=UPI00341373DF
MSRYRRITLILPALALALTACGRLYELPPPQGEPVVLKPAEMATTWTDADGGTLTLKQDGTFVADKVCVAVGWEEDLAWSGTGTWKHESDKDKTQSFLDVSFDADHPETDGRPVDDYAALKQGKVLKLWAAVGDPDHDHPHCTLTRPAG